MTWFPQEQNIPGDASVPRIDIPALMMNAFNRVNQVNADDVTFIIPYAGDSAIRRDNLIDCLSWLIYNTTAKVKIHWCETEESFFNPEGAFREMVMGHPELLDNMWKFLKKNCSGKEGPLKNVLLDNENLTASVGIEGGSHHVVDTFKDIFVNMFLTSWVPSLNVQGQPSFHQKFAEEYGGPEAQMLFPTEGFKKFSEDINNRLEVSFELRKDGAPFHRTKYLNRMLNCVVTPITCNHDADIILPHESLKRTLEMFRIYPKVGAVYPYEHHSNGRYQVRIFEEGGLREEVKLAILTGDLTQVLMHEATCLWSGGYGQSVFVRTNLYKQAGGENEEFISWGAEDVERYFRLIKLGVHVARVRGYILHLEHPRGVDSGKYHSSFDNNESLWEKLQVLEPRALADYYLQADYLKQYDWLKAGVK